MAIATYQKRENEIFDSLLISAIEATTRQNISIIYIPPWKVFFMLFIFLTNEKAMPREVINKIMAAV